METIRTGTSEYDRFGPWIDEVRSADDVPRLFRGHALDLDAARLVLKVPRSIARRDATPDMDLYDHLLALGAETLTVLSRTAPDRRTTPYGAGYAEQTVPLHEIAVVHDVVDLLHGRLTIRTTGGSDVTVDYNGSARAHMTRLVGARRDAASAAPPSPVGALLADAGRAAVTDGATRDLGRDDQALEADFREVAGVGARLAVWAAHGRRRLVPRGAGWDGLVHRLSHTLSPATLQGAVLAGGAGALEVFGRREQVTRGTAPVVSSSRLVVPLSTLTRLDVGPDPRYEGTVVVGLRTTAVTTTLVVPEDSAAARLVAGVTGASGVARAR